MVGRFLPPPLPMTVVITPRQPSAAASHVYTTPVVRELPRSRGRARSTRPGEPAVSRRAAGDPRRPPRARAASACGRARRRSRPASRRRRSRGGRGSTIEIGLRPLAGRRRARASGRRAGGRARSRRSSRRTGSGRARPRRAAGTACRAARAGGRTRRARPRSTRRAARGRRRTGRRRWRGPLVVAEEQLRQAALVVGAQEDVADRAGMSVVKVVTWVLTSRTGRT